MTEETAADASIETPAPDPAAKRSRETERLVEELRKLYSDYRTSVLNEKFYGVHFHRVERSDLALEIAVAITFALAGAVITLWDSAHGRWSDENGHMIAAGFAATAAILAGVKPILPLGRLKLTYSKLYQGHRRNALEYKELVAEVRKKQRMTSEFRSEHERLVRRHRELAEEDQPHPSKKLLETLQAEVEKQIPVTLFWYPG